MKKLIENTQSECDQTCGLCSEPYSLHRAFPPALHDLPAHGPHVAEHQDPHTPAPKCFFNSGCAGPSSKACQTPPRPTPTSPRQRPRQGPSGPDGPINTPAPPTRTPPPASSAGQAGPKQKSQTTPSRYEHSTSNSFILCAIIELAYGFKLLLTWV